MASKFNPYYQVDVDCLVNQISFSDEDIDIEKTGSMDENYLDAILSSLNSIENFSLQNITEDEKDVVKKVFFDNYTVADALKFTERNVVLPTFRSPGEDDETYTLVRFDEDFISLPTIENVQATVFSHNSRVQRYSSDDRGKPRFIMSAKEQIKNLEHVETETSDQEDDYFIW